MDNAKKNATAYPHWNLPEIDLPDDAVPSYIPHATRPLRQIEEMGAAINEPYPHFLAVLTPERNFLHYILSGLICDVGFSDKTQLFSQAKRLYKTHVEKVDSIYANKQKGIAQEVQKIGELAKEYYKKRKGHASSGLPASSEWNSFFEETYDKIQNNLFNNFHVVGTHDTKTLNTAEKVFCAICQDEYERKENQKIARAVAENVIQKAMDDKELKPLPLYKKNDPSRENIVVAGVIAAGKSYFLEMLFGSNSEAWGGMAKKREEFAFIDVDEWKEFLLLNDGDSDQKSSWNKRAYDECYQIRRKIFDKLEEKTAENHIPNVVMATTLLPQRVLDWLTQNNVKTTLHLTYCDPDQALKNSLERHQKTGRYTSTKTVLNSVSNMAKAVNYLLYQTTHGNKNVNIQMEDTTKARSESSKTVFTSSALKGLTIYDPEAFFKIEQGVYIDPDATSPDKIYQAFTPQQIDERIKAILRPHDVEFASMGIDGITGDYPSEVYARKRPGKDEVTMAPYITTPSQSQLAALKRLDPEFDTRPKGERFYGR